ncbi:MAG: chemotaxis protein CheW [Cyanobacteria bacterium QH_8_48_120]|jgi:twitching motility protein PilI|nr:MAG: chemotaxis protein CheW [Cyanobacteria bacterium QH_1_48_107]PSO64882.1 MAG: chemotaxis protein CheW [Cyanobacteria bacterium QH_6_48_35]PSO70758.1 MAG: chemotaxis protein CheW [Cyanobacteria bacterium QS_1_48_34]PSO72619.1 MAG: chemotaxis protein CheW [Cyanobacteria bacterium QH_8_48_120]PSP33778.1 MAG: chemotaxis protein CheW [Cyanobacteria bacterium QS_8_48_54]
MVDHPSFSTGGDEQSISSELQELETPEGELHLRFYLPSGKEFALPATGIREVVFLSSHIITVIPNTSFSLLGTMNLRGHPVWVADFAQFLGEMGSLNTQRQEIPVIAIEERETLIGLAVEEIVGMDWLDVEQIEVPTNLPNSMAPFVQGAWNLNPESAQLLWLLDQGAILRSTRWAA